MDNLQSLVAAWLLMMGAHEGSHQMEADKQGVPMTWDKDGVWTAHTRDRDRLANVSGAGIRGQQSMVESLPQGDLKDNVTLMSALNKIMYAVKPTGFNLMAGEDSDPKKEPGGDTAMLNRLKPQNIMQPALIASGLADLYKSQHPDTKWSLDFGQSQRGTPTLMYRRQW